MSDIALRVENLGKQYKIGMAFEIRKTDSGILCTRGNSEQLAVRYPTMEMEFAIPEDVRQALQCL